MSLRFLELEVSHCLIVSTKSFSFGLIAIDMSMSKLQRSGYRPYPSFLASVMRMQPLQLHSDLDNATNLLVRGMIIVGNDFFFEAQ